MSASNNHSTKSPKQEPKSESYDKDLVQLLKQQLKELRQEMQELRSLAKETRNAPVIDKEVKKLETTVGTVLLDLAEEIPLVGNLVKWFR